MPTSDFVAIMGLIKYQLVIKNAKNNLANLFLNGGWCKNDQHMPILDILEGYRS